MRYVIANWKSRLGLAASRDAAEAVMAAVGVTPGLTAVLCPSFPALPAVERVLHGSGICLGSQDVSASAPGACTGEVPAEMLKEIGCAYAIVGHSERRERCAETDATTNSKVLRLLEAGITPVICVGEIAAERESSLDVIHRQLVGCLKGVSLSADQRLLVAYEPRWAIGTGLAASPEDVGVAVRACRELLSQKLGEGRFAVLYGGSVNPDNVASFFAVPGVDGVLAGTASVSPDSFAALCKA